MICVRVKHILMFAPGWKLQSLVWRQGEATTGTLYLRVQGEEEHCSTAALHCSVQTAVQCDQDHHQHGISSFISRVCHFLSLDIIIY